MTKKIKSFYIDTSDMRAGVVQRYFKITGDIGAYFSLEVTNEDTHYYNFETKTFTSTYYRLSDKKMTSTVYSDYIEFPAITDDDEYNIHLYAEPHYNTELSGVNFNNNIHHKVENENTEKDESGTLKRPSSIHKFTDVTITFSLASPANSATYNTLPSDVTITKPRNFVPTADRQEYNDVFKNKRKIAPEQTRVDIEWDVSLSSSQFVVARQPVITDFEVTRTKIVDGATSSVATAILNDIDELRIGQEVSGTRVTSNSVISKVVKDTKTVTFDRTSSLNDDDVITIKDKGSRGAEALYNTFFTLDKASVSLDPVVTTTDDTVSNNSTIPIASTDGIKASENTTMRGLGVTSTLPHVDAVNAGVSVTVSSNQTLENGQTMTFTGSSRSAKIKATLYILRFGDENFQATLNLDNILTVG